MGDDRLLWKVAGVFAVSVAAFAGFLAVTPGIELTAAFGTGPVGVALAAGAVILGVAGYVALEVSADEVFAD
jgi:hypothetical protein